MNNDMKIVVDGDLNTFLVTPNVMVRQTGNLSLSYMFTAPGFSLALYLVPSDLISTAQDRQVGLNPISPVSCIRPLPIAI